jgi:hypothetical protein
MKKAWTENPITHETIKKPGELDDPRLVGTSWSKKQVSQEVIDATGKMRNITVHYLYNTESLQVTDFKFTNPRIL